MNINDIIYEALAVLNKDNSPVIGNFNYLKSDITSSSASNGISGNNNLNWQYNTAPPVAKIQEKRSAKMHSITDKSGTLKD